MKWLRLIIIFAIAHCAVLTARSEVEPKNIDFDTFPLDQVETTVNSLHGARRAFEFATGAMRSKRIDIITACFENQYTMGCIRDDDAKLPDSTFKDEVVLAMLKSKSIFWGPEPMPENGSHPMRVPLNLEPFKSVIKRHLPDEPVDETFMRSRAMRLKLAEELEKAIAMERAKGTGESVKTPVPITATPKPGSK